MRTADMSAWVRRRLLDTGAVPRFTGDDILSAINVGAWQVQARIMEVNPNAFRRVTLRNLIANTYRYQNVRGTLQYRQVYVLYSGATDYVKASITTEVMIEDPASKLASEAGVHYAVGGGELLIYPTPTVSVSDGIKTVEVPAIEVDADDDDLENSGLLAPFHIAVVLWAVKLLKPEDAEDLKGIDLEIEKIMSKVPALYGGTGQAGGPEFLSAENMGMELT